MTFSPGKILLGAAAVLAVVLAAGFIAVVFFEVSLFGG
jgi:hypothetical protein